MISGVLVVDKPEGFTSFDAVAVARKAAGEKKAGHTGTLDPMATGVLPILFGAATKAVNFLPDTDKEYLASFRLGEKYDTGDVTGALLGRDDTMVSREDLLAALGKFAGETEQLPPMYSAVSIGGRRLYQLAREGREVERVPRKIKISLLKLLEYSPERREGRLKLRCSKGTYVRALIEDIARELGTLGVMTALRRTAACGFSENDAVPLLELREMPKEEIEGKMFCVERLFLSFPAVLVSDSQGKRFLNGGALSHLGRNFTFENGTKVRIKTKDDGFLGLAEADTERGELKFLKILTERR